MDIELEAMRRLAPLALFLGALFVIWLEARVFPLFKRACAGHRVVTRRLGVTDADIAAELDQLGRKEAA